jgi:hypothetical protein
VRGELHAPAEAVGVAMSGLFVGAQTGPVFVGLMAESPRFDVAWAMEAGLLLAAPATVGAAQRSG